MPVHLRCCSLLLLLASGALRAQSVQPFVDHWDAKKNIKKSEGYEPSNEVKGYEAITGTAAPAFSAPGFQQAPQQAAPAANTPPWAAAAGKAA